MAESIVNLHANESHDIRMTGHGVLIVCLCDDDQATPIPGMAGMDQCEHHSAVRLRGLLNAGYNVLLHVIDESGDVVPVTSAMVREVM